MLRKSVLVYAGPAGSGKTYNMQMFMRIRGIKCKMLSFLYSIPNSNWILEVAALRHKGFIGKDAEGIEHLFIDDYNLESKNGNFFLDRVACSGITVVVTSHTELTRETKESLPPSFRITRCNYKPKEVTHA